MKEHFPLGQIFTFQTEPMQSIAEEGWKKICELVRSETGVNIDGTIVGDTWEADPNNKYGPGNLPSRVEKYVYRASGHSPKPDLKKRIGDIATAHLVKVGTYHFDFDDQLKWKQGEFGDSQACFMIGGSAKHALPILRHYGSLAMRFYNEAGKGIARSWLLFPQKDSARAVPHDDVSKFVVICNAYSSAYGLNLNRQATILAKWSGLKLATAICTNEGDGSYFYLNADDGGDSIQFVLSEHDAPPRKIYLDWYRAPIKCEHCGRDTNDSISFDGNYYCKVCFTKLFFTCQLCRTTCTKPCSAAGKMTMICAKCAALYLPCLGCGTLTFHGRKESPYNRHQYCPHCVEREFYICRSCGEIAPSASAKEYGGRKYCQNCWNAGRDCDICKTHIPSGGSYDVEGESLCEDCKQKCVGCRGCGKSIYHAVVDNGKKYCRSCGGNVTCYLCRQEVKLYNVVNRNYRRRNGKVVSVCNKHEKYPCYDCGEYRYLEDKCEHYGVGRNHE